MPPKRKQAPDMPTSPPKRVTRARAKKEVDSKPQTHVKTPSARAAAKKKATTPKEEPQEVDAQLDEEMKEPEAAVNTEPMAAEPPKTRGKAKATSASTASHPKPSVAPAKSTRSRTTNTTATADKGVQPPKPKGRPKRNAEPEAPVSSGLAVEKNPEPPAKATRSRVASAAVSKPATTRARAAAVAPKKRVKFDDENEDNKENVPIIAKSQEKQGPKAAGLRAKPLRKPATTRSAAKDKTTRTQESKVEEHATKPDILPLSPKKITQVAKTPSSASEDELAGEKTPLRPLSVSPSKIPTAVNPDRDINVSRMEVEQIDVPESPTKEATSAGLTASPRKPPPSPYKDALKASPRKVDLGSRTGPPKFDAPPSPTKSPLKESPKRVNLGDSMAKPKLQWSKTPVKSSLFQSPARRPGSSMKTTMFSSSKGTVVPVVDAATASKQVSTFKLPALTAESAASSPLRAARSPTFKVHDSKKDEIHSQETIPSPSPLSESEADVMGPTGEPENDEDAKSRPDGLDQSVREEATPESPQVKVQQAGLDFAGGNETMSHTAAETIQEDFDTDLGIDQQQAGGMTTDGMNVPDTTASPTFFSKPAFVLASPMIAGRIDDSESEDELSSPQKSAGSSPLKNFGVSAKDFGDVGVAATQQEQTPTTQSRRASLRAAKRSSIAFTPLAMQMNSWLASSPEKQDRPQRSHKRGIFSPAPPSFPKETVQSPAALTGGSPAKVSFFDDEMVVRSEQDAALVLDEGSTDELEGPSNAELLAMQGSQEFHEDENYGDENAAPEQADFYLLHQAQDQTLTCTPARVFDQRSREVHTVSKVPLRPAADDDTPLKVPRKRSRSLAGPLSDINMSNRVSIGQDSILSPILKDTNLPMDMLPGDPAAPSTPETPTGGSKSAVTTPGRSIRKAGFSNVLKGAVVHVDVHTTEGADASGIFVDLLTQMGARCVKQWHWNPQANIAGESSPESSTPGSKIGITHVVYKDGGKRTLEKVREAKGAVLCVGVGWVLE
ncbi:MAG: hypothetical protein Q9174_002087 [Haloplaca sp. 1 TL-2023]